MRQALRRLRVDRPDLLQLHRLDPAVPLAEQLGALGDLQVAGLVGQLGLSDVSVADLAEARQVAEIASVQNRYSMLLHREHDPVLAACGAAGIAFLPWRPVADATQADAAELDAVAAELGERRAGVAGLAAAPVAGGAADSRYGFARPPHRERRRGRPATDRRPAGPAGPARRPLTRRTPIVLAIEVALGPSTEDGCPGRRDCDRVRAQTYSSWNFTPARPAEAPNSVARPAGFSHSSCRPRAVRSR